MYDEGFNDCIDCLKYIDAETEANIVDSGDIFEALIEYLETRKEQIRDNIIAGFDEYE